MPSVHVKQKCFENTGEVLSYKPKPNVFYYREAIKGKGTYRSEKIHGAETLEDALAKAYEVHARFRQADAGVIADNLSLHQKQKARRFQQLAAEVQQYSEGTVTINRRSKRRGKPIEQAVQEWIDHEQKRCDKGRIKERTVKQKAWVLEKIAIPYLQSKGVTNTNQIDNTTFRAYDTFSNSKTPTALGNEITSIRDWVNNWLIENKLIQEDVVFSKRSFPKVTVNPDDLMANPAINSNDWKILNKAIRDHCEYGRKHENYRVYYWRFLFWHFTLVMYGSGARPEELLKVKWKDVKFRDVGRRSNTRLNLMLSRMRGEGLDGLSKEELKEVQQLNKRFPDLDNLNENDLDIIGRVPDIWSDIKVTSSKTGATRIIPCQEYEVLKRLKEYQLKHIRKNIKWRHVTINPDSYVFGHPGRDMKPHPYSNYNKTWIEIRRRVEPRLEGHFISNYPYTIYSMRSSFIENLLMAGKDMFMIAKVAGHDPKILMKHYERIDVRKRTRELSQIQYGRKANREIEVEL